MSSVSACAHIVHTNGRCIHNVIGHTVGREPALEAQQCQRVRTGARLMATASSRPVRPQPKRRHHTLAHRTRSASGPTIWFFCADHNRDGFSRCSGVNIGTRAAMACSQVAPQLRLPQISARGKPGKGGQSAAMISREQKTCLEILVTAVHAHPASFPANYNSQHARCNRRAAPMRAARHTRLLPLPASALPEPQEGPASVNGKTR